PRVGVGHREARPRRGGRPGAARRHEPPHVKARVGSRIELTRRGSETRESSRPMALVAVMMSYRLGGADGVAVEARKWEWALHELGFRVRRVAGELDDGLRPDDTWLAFLAIDPVNGATPQPD